MPAAELSFSALIISEPQLVVVAIAVRALVSVSMFSLSLDALIISEPRCFNNNFRTCTCTQFVFAEPLPPRLLHVLQWGYGYGVGLPPSGIGSSLLPN
jgi:hypothetical protein